MTPITIGLACPQMQEHSTITPVRERCHGVKGHENVQGRPRSTLAAGDFSD
eukprot:m.225510 g.225510  ORF g.225510 m.225510 type:complete len:51 (+) comp15160_c0_seq2:2441-2593(+)